MWQMMTRIYEQAARVINDKINIGTGWNSPYVDPKTNQTVPNTAQPKCKDNVQGALVLVTFTGGVVQIFHNLGYIPRCYVPLWKSAPCDVYDSATAGPGNGPGLGLMLDPAKTLPNGTNPATTGATTNWIKLMSTTAATVLLLIF